MQLEQEEFPMQQEQLRTDKVLVRQITLVPIVITELEQDNLAQAPQN